MLTLERIKEIIDTHFTHPNLNDVSVTSKFIDDSKEKTLQINIGKRDIWINENGEVTAAGTTFV